MSPASTAFLASNPAPSITVGLEVFVQEVIAEITTEPWRRMYSLPSYVIGIAESDRLIFPQMYCILPVLCLSEGMLNPLNPTGF